LIKLTQRVFGSRAKGKVEGSFRIHIFVNSDFSKKVLADKKRDVYQSQDAFDMVEWFLIICPN